MLAINRSDYMLDAPSSTLLQASDPLSKALRQANSFTPSQGCAWTIPMSCQAEGEER